MITHATCPEIVRRIVKRIVRYIGLIGLHFIGMTSDQINFKVSGRDTKALNTPPHK